ncbi:cold shock domain-containing protein E1 isoform X4 [Tachysurus ichikawai]
MGSPWKGFVEFTLPASPPAAFVSAELSSTSTVGLSLSPYGRSVSAVRLPFTPPSFLPHRLPSLPLQLVFPSTPYFQFSLLCPL